MTRMVDYLEETVDDFSVLIDGKESTPAAMHSFTISDNPIMLDQKRSEEFHHVVAKLL